ncbi:HAD family phosphatase [soil metagenome]
MQPEGPHLSWHAHLVAVPSFQPESVDALLFDLGGVIIDIDFRRCFARWADGARCGVDEIASRFTIDAPYEDHERGVLDVAGYFDSLRHGLSVELSDDQLLEGWSDVYVGVKDGIAPILDAARTKFPLYAFTNSNPSHQAVWSERFAADLEVFTSTFVSSELGERKPDRAAFDAVVAMICVPASSILFFDDSPENCDGASDAGLQAVHVTSTDSVRTALSRLGVQAPQTEDRVDGSP